MDCFFWRIPEKEGNRKNMIELICLIEKKEGCGERELNP
jgi:hypothetical protein